MVRGDGLYVWTSVSSTYPEAESSLKIWSKRIHVVSTDMRAPRSRIVDQRLSCLSFGQAGIDIVGVEPSTLVDPHKHDPVCAETAATGNPSNLPTTKTLAPDFSAICSVVVPLSWPSRMAWKAPSWTPMRRAISRTGFCCGNSQLCSASVLVLLVSRGIIYHSA